MAAAWPVNMGRGARAPSSGAPARIRVATTDPSHTAWGVAWAARRGVCVKGAHVGLAPLDLQQGPGSGACGGGSAAANAKPGVAAAAEGVGINKDGYSARGVCR